VNGELIAALTAEHRPCRPPTARYKQSPESSEGL